MLKIKNLNAGVDDKNILNNINLSSKNINIYKDISYSQLQNLFRQNNTYIHSSEYETVGLPIYEALSNGLNVVMPDREYFQLNTCKALFYQRQFFQFLELV